MEIIINGETKSYDREMTVVKLLEVLDIPTNGIAVEINKEIIPRSKHSDVIVKNNDVVEIVRMVGGGW